MATTLTNHTAEARRYIANAREILSEKAGKQDGFYQDKKYVRMAGNTAYNGVLEALDGVFTVKRKGRKSVEWYQENLANTDRKLLDKFNSAYDILHLFMGYDGTKDATVAATGLKRAEEIIAWAELRTQVV